MFQLDHPEVVEVIKGSRLLPSSTNQQNSDSEQTLFTNNKKIVVVSIFGTSHLNLSGHKRAFRLSIDCLGNLKLFSDDKICPRVSTPTTSLVDDPFAIFDHTSAVLHDFCQDSPKSPKNAKKTNDDDTQDTNNDVKISTPLDITSDSDNLSSLDGFYCDNEGILFLHLDGAYDPKRLLASGQELHEAIKDTGFIPVWSNLKSKYCRCLLLMFSLSHILILSETGGSLDTSYLHLFRVLDAVRLEIKPAITRVLDQLGNIPKDWIQHGRICSPRLLFLFEMESDSAITIKTAANLHRGPLKERQMQLEDEIYHILRKCRIITNISANSLFAIPSDDEYIFLYEKSAQNSSHQDEPLTSTYLEIINQACLNVKNSNKQTPGVLAHRCLSGSSIKNSFRLDSKAITYNDILKKFKAFLLTHTRLALTKGFDDDSRRVAEYKHFFVTPTFHQWKSAFQALNDCLLCSSTDDRTINEGLLQLQKFINVDSQYLENQCADVFPKIYAAYQRGLPEFYSERLHHRRLNFAMNAYLSISRGPGVLPWLTKLAEKCERYWKRGRQQCETMSLFRHPCVNPMHRIALNDNLEILPVPEMDPKLPEMLHSTGSRLISYCDCSRRQASRDEPFTIKEANYGFYQRVGKECCDRLEKYAFPVFTPVNNTSGFSIQEMLQILKHKSVAAESEEKSTDDIQTPLEEHSNESVMEMDLRQENILGDEGSDGSQNEQDNQEDTELVEEDTDGVTTKLESVVINEEEREKGSGVSSLSKPNHSHTEYLPGMLHSKTPLGLLPQFPSWSLVCLGSSSLYNHSSGVTPRQGFLSGTNFLLPWDVMVKAEAGVAKPIPRFIRGKRPLYGKARPISDEFNVKVFIGLEYECHRGHRFFANDYEKIIHFHNGSNSSFKEAGAKVANSEMPLYFKCPCKESRDGRVMIAQLMRIHVVTPKAPVHCMLSPRVQPSTTPCSTFFPGNQEPIKLTPSSYWVLRLPYCYVGEEVYVQPNETDVNRLNGKLLKGTFSVKSMTPAETKSWEKLNLS